MTNHELARLLLSQPELPMFFVSTDPTDFTYTFPIEDEHVYVDEELYLDEETDLPINENFNGSITASVIQIDI